MHKDWCGKACYECENPCEADKSMPCSPDCKLLGEDGTPKNIELCMATGCDAKHFDNLLYTVMSRHIGHNVSIVSYANDENISLECEDCGCVLFDSDVYDLTGVI